MNTVKLLQGDGYVVQRAQCECDVKLGLRV
jgi:hypothetical protein